VAPAGTPAAVIGRLNAEIASALAAPDVREKAIAAGCEPAANSPQEFAAFIRDEARKWADVIRKAGVKIE
jgi:tripartite-type tricarboxylate transporter receptor subunit TctC